MKKKLEISIMREVLHDFAKEYKSLTDVDILPEEIESIIQYRMKSITLYLNDKEIICITTHEYDKLQQ